MALHVPLRQARLCDLDSRLPFELVIRIFRLANCLLPIPELCQSASLSDHSTIPPPPPPAPAEISRIPWFSTPPVDHHMLSRVAAFQLLTTSQDRDWVSDPNTTGQRWFEVAISEGRIPLKLKRNEIDGRVLLWTSHYITEGDSSQLEGMIFGREHEIWEHLAEGDVIQIIFCAKYDAGPEIDQGGLLKVMEWFEPTLPPRLAN